MSFKKTPVSLDSKLNQVATTTPIKYSAEVPFKAFFDEAQKETSLNSKVIPAPINSINNSMNPLTLSKNAAVLAQAVNQNQIDDRQQKNKTVTGRNQTQSQQSLDRTPFQIFIDKAVEVLDRVSQQEVYVNNLTEEYISGKVSIDEVSIEATKLNMAITFVTTVITTASTTLKELTGMQI